MSRTEQIQQKQKPPSFNLYNKIEFCSNKLINVPYLIGIDGFAPIIITKGELPIVTLYTFIPTAVNQWIPIVEENKSLTRTPVVTVKKEKDTITIRAKGTILIRATNKDDTCIISSFDLRPIGFEVYGDQNSLYVGRNTISENTLVGNGSQFFIGLSAPQPRPYSSNKK